MEQPIQFKPATAHQEELPSSFLRDLALYRGPSEPTRCTCPYRPKQRGHLHGCPCAAELRLTEALAWERKPY